MVKKNQAHLPHCGPLDHVGQKQVEWTGGRKAAGQEESLGRLDTRLSFKALRPYRLDDASGLGGCTDTTALQPGRTCSLLTPSSAPAPVVGAELELALLGG